MDEPLITRLVSELNKCTSKHSFDAIIATDPTNFSGLRLVTIYRSSCFKLVESYPLKMQINGELGQYGMCLVFEDLRTRRLLTIVNMQLHEGIKDVDQGLRMQQMAHMKE